jgi:ABC-type antimicrobial peptide transport system permease subunit
MAKLKILFKLSLLMVVVTALSLTADEEYNSVMSEFGLYNKRLPGSKGYKKCIAKVESILQKAGLETNRQTFDTLVPETTECRIIIDGKEIQGVYALGPNEAAANTIGDKTLTGPLVWLNDGTFEDMKGKPVKGCIAVLNFNSKNMKDVFSQGALAVIYVGNGEETRFDARNQFTQAPVEVPRFFVFKETAEKNKMMSYQPGRKATVSLKTIWKSVEGVNLWTVIPGEKDAKFKSDKEEAVILSATIDTFGVIPELCPDQRNAANCALLTQTAIELSKKPLKRSVVIIFFGSHYAMQDGARMFYFAYTNGGLNSKYGKLDDRAKMYKNEINKIKSKIELMQRKNIFKEGHPDLKETVESLDKRLEAKVSVLNIQLGTLYQTRKKLNDEVKRLNKKLKKEELTPAEIKKTKDEIQKIEEKVNSDKEISETIKAKRSKLNEMRRQLNDGEVTDFTTFKIIADEERAWLQREIKDNQRLLEHNKTYQEIYEKIGLKSMIGHYGFDFANANDDWTLTVNGIGAQMFYHTPNRKWSEIKTGKFKTNINTLRIMSESPEYGANEKGPSFFSDPIKSFIKPSRFCIPTVRSVPTRVAHANQIFGYQMMTVADPLEKDEMPYNYKTDLATMLNKITAFCSGLANFADLSQPCPLAAPKLQKNTVVDYIGMGSLRFLTYVKSSQEVEGVPKRGIAYCTPQRTFELPVIPGNSYSATSRILASGQIFMPYIFSNGPVRPFGYDENGKLSQFPVGGYAWHPNRMFYGFGGPFFVPMNVGGYGIPRCSIVEGVSDSKFSESCMTSFPEGVMFYGNRETNIKAFAKGGIMVLGNGEEDPKGKGISVLDPPIYTLNVLNQTAHDYMNLNDSRLQILRDKAIINDSLEILNADAREHWDNAVEARKNNDIPTALGHEAFASSIGARVSTPLKNITNDMIKAVVVLLLLTIPFAFAMERLIFNAVSIYNQVVGFAVFFLATFALLYITHPAFTIASSPIIIFLAFIIILLSVMVMVIVMSKFKRELRAIQGLSTSAHGVASDSSTAMAAVLIGISGMRNRPLKTFLIALTIIMLTFTIVVFASFTPIIGVKDSYLGKGTGTSRIELRRFTGLGLPSSISDSLKALYGDEWKVYTRQTLSRGPQIEAEGNLVLFTKDKKIKKWEKLEAMIAFNPEELEANPDLAKAIPDMKTWKSKNGDDTPPLFLHPSIPERMKLQKGDEVYLNGIKFIYAGNFNNSLFDQLTYLDNAKYTPPDFEISKQEMGEEGSIEQMDQQVEAFVDATRFSYLPSRNVAITLNGSLSDLVCFELSEFNSAIVMYPNEEADVEKTAKEISKFFMGSVLAKGAKGVNKFFFSEAMQASGFSMLIVPLLLGGLIIFNSLLGSIVDRQKEIFTYSALGLSPPNVGALFFAESGVYAVLGGMGGYLVSQIASKVVYICGEQGWFVPPEMNFSSLSSVLTILIVMAVVIISTIYPALKAGRSANPGLARKWKMPKPDGDKIEFVFPFTVSANDMTGILAFIVEHFENHGDSSLGSFAASKVKMYVKNKIDTDGDGDKEDFCGIRANVSLAPFDLGVMQEFEMFARPSEIEDIDEVVVSLKKISGTKGAWMRGNKVFVDELRQQFLFWRSLPIQTVEHYREKGEKSTGGKTA